MWDGGALGVVLSPEEPLRKGPDVDLTNAVGILSEQLRQREDKLADSWFQETNKEDILTKKFEEAMKKAKDAPAGKPIRDFDLDYVGQAFLPVLVSVKSGLRSTDRNGCPAVCMTIAFNRLNAETQEISDQSRLP